MRRMISENQAEGLRRLNNSIVVNDDGTLVEIGGNVAVESIEQIGYMKQVAKHPATWQDVNGKKFHVIIPAGTTLPTSGNISGAISNLNPEAEAALETRSGGSGYVGIGFIPGPTTFYLMTTLNPQTGIKTPGGGAATTIDVECDIDAGMGQTSGATAWLQYLYYYEDEFTPFFTEEQYEAVLDLIENA